MYLEPTVQMLKRKNALTENESALKPVVVESIYLPVINVFTFRVDAQITLYSSSHCEDTLHVQATVCLTTTQDFLDTTQRYPWLPGNCSRIASSCEGPRTQKVYFCISSSSEPKNISTEKKGSSFTDDHLNSAIIDPLPPLYIHDTDGITSDKIMPIIIINHGIMLIKKTQKRSNIN